MIRLIIFLEDANLFLLSYPNSVSCDVKTLYWTEKPGSDSLEFLNFVGSDFLFLMYFDFHLDFR